MWTDVGITVAVLGAALVGGGTIRHRQRMAELARDDEDDRRRETGVAVFTQPPTISDLESGTVTDAPTGVGWARWRPWPGGLRADRARLNADTTRVLEPLKVAVPEGWNKDTGLIPVVQRRIPRPVKVSDELGEWEPSEHAGAEPLILGDVLGGRQWKSVRPGDVGMGSR